MLKQAGSGACRTPASGGRPTGALNSGYLQKLSYDATAKKSASDRSSPCPLSSALKITQLSAFKKKATFSKTLVQDIIAAYMHDWGEVLEDDDETGRQCIEEFLDILSCMKRYSGIFFASKQLQVRSRTLLDFMPSGGDILGPLLYRSEAVRAMLKLERVANTGPGSVNYSWPNSIEDEKYYAFLEDSLRATMICPGFKVSEAAVSRWKQIHGDMTDNFGTLNVWCSEANYSRRVADVDEAYVYLYSRHCTGIPIASGQECAQCQGIGVKYGPPSKIPQTLVSKEMSLQVLHDLSSGKVAEPVDIERVRLYTNSIEARLLQEQRMKSHYKKQLEEAREAAESIYGARRKQTFSSVQEKDEYKELCRFMYDKMEEEMPTAVNKHRCALAKELFLSEYQYLGKFNKAGGKAGVVGQYSPQVLSYYVNYAWRLGKKAYEEERDVRAGLPCWNTLLKYRKDAEQQQSGINHVEITAAYLHATQVLQDRNFIRGTKGKEPHQGFWSTFILVADGMGIVDKFDFDVPTNTASGGVDIAKHPLDIIFNSFAQNKSQDGPGDVDTLTALAKKADLENTIATQLMAFQLLNPSIPGFKYTVWSGFTTSLAGFELSKITLCLTHELFKYNMRVSATVMDGASSNNQMRNEMYNKPWQCPVLDEVIGCFYHPCSLEPVFFISDWSHLAKKLRNCALSPRRTIRIYDNSLPDLRYKPTVNEDGSLTYETLPLLYGRFSLKDGEALWRFLELRNQTQMSATKVRKISASHWNPDGKALMNVAMAYNVLGEPFLDMITKGQRILWFDTDLNDTDKRTLEKILHDLSGYYLVAQLFCETKSILNSKRFVNAEWNRDKLENLKKIRKTFNSWRRSATQAFERGERIIITDKKNHVVTINDCDQHFFTTETSNDFDNCLGSTTAWLKHYTSFDCYVRLKDVTQDHLENEYNLIRSQSMCMNGRLSAAMVKKSMAYLSVQRIDGRKRKRQHDRKGNTFRADDDEQSEDEDDEDTQERKKIIREIKLYYKDAPLPPDLSQVRMELERDIDLNIDLAFLD